MGSNPSQPMATSVVAPAPPIDGSGDCGVVESLCGVTTGSQSEDGDSSCTSDICLVVTPSPLDGLRVPPSSSKSTTDDELSDDAPMKPATDLPDKLRTLPVADEFTTERHRWNTNEEVAGILLAFHRHADWLSKEVTMCPSSGSMLLYSRRKVRYRKDGYCWKKRRDGKTIREDHMKLKVRGIECIYGCYVHSAILPSFHRRCYWLLQNPDIVLVHYLNVTEDTRQVVCHAPETSDGQWSEDELIKQLKPMLTGIQGLQDVLKDPTQGEPLKALLQSILSAELGSTKAGTSSSMRPKSESSRDSVFLKPLAPSSMKPMLETKPKQSSLLPRLHPATVEPVAMLAQQQQQQMLGVGECSEVPTTQLPFQSARDSSTVYLNVAHLPGSSNVLIISSADGLSRPVNSSRPAAAASDALWQLNGRDVGELSGLLDNDGHDEHPQTTTLEMLDNSHLDLIGSVEQGDIDLQRAGMSHEEVLADNLHGHFEEMTSDAADSLNFDVDYVIDSLLQPHANEAAGGHSAADSMHVLNTGFSGFLKSGISYPSIEDNLICIQPPSNNPHQAVITDFSPDWSSSKGGSKLLITGPWVDASRSYGVMFDCISVRAELVQAGVLRCYTPSHIPGKVKFKVTCDGYVVSNVCELEYRSDSVSPAEAVGWFYVSDEHLKCALIERFQNLIQRLNTSMSISELSSHSLLESHLVNLCNSLALCQWSNGKDLLPANHSQLSILHLVSSLGYEQLARLLMFWKQKNTSVVLNAEVDGMSVDKNSCTALMWSSSRGHSSLALLLYQWCPASYAVTNKYGMTALALARYSGHSELVHQLESRELSRLSERRKQPSVASQSSAATARPVTVCLSDPGQLAPPCNVRPDVTRTSQSQTRDVGSETPKPASASARIRRTRLLKRTSVEVLPDYCGSSSLLRGDSPVKYSKATGVQGQGGRVKLRDRQHSDRMVDMLHEPTTASGDVLAKDPMISTTSRDLYSPVMFLDSDGDLADGGRSRDSAVMDTDLSSCSQSAKHLHGTNFDLNSTMLGGSSLSMSSGTSGHQSQSSPQPPQMMTLARQIIAAMPDRIKASPGRGDDISVQEEVKRYRNSSYSSISSCSSSPPYGDDSGVSTPLELESMNFDDARYASVGSPSSSLSQASTNLHSPYSFSIDSPPPTAAEFNEYFNAPSMFMEKDFSQLTLTDEEQRRLYKAARIIQSFYRRYKNKKELQRQQRQKEFEAAVLIQSYYRRYKQYMYYKKMTQAAVLIQNQFRSYCAQKRLRQGSDATGSGGNPYHRTYKPDQEQFKKNKSTPVMVQQRFRSHYQRKRSQGEASLDLEDMMEDVEASHISRESDTRQKCGNVENTSSPTSR